MNLAGFGFGPLLPLCILIAAYAGVRGVLNLAGEALAAVLGSRDDRRRHLPSVRYDHSGVAIDSVPVLVERERRTRAAENARYAAAARVIAASEELE
jgi:hypothetical protein